MEKNEIKDLIKQVLNEEYVGWKAPVLPGNAQEGDVLVAKEDFIDPPLDISNKVEWKTPEDNPQPGPTPGEDYVKSVNSQTPDENGNVVLNASDIRANNTQTIQANLERIDSNVEDTIDIVQDHEERITDIEANKQHKLIPGSNITITPGEDGDTISASGGSGGGCAWGEITGTLANQTDLNNALDDLDTTKANKSNYETLVFTLDDDTTVTLKLVKGE